MKFEKARPEFTPIIITLETEVEAQALLAVLANAVGRKLDGDFLFKLYEKLDELYLREDRMFKTSGRVSLERRDS